MNRPSRRANLTRSTGRYLFLMVFILFFTGCTASKNVPRTVDQRVENILKKEILPLAASSEQANGQTVAHISFSDLFLSALKRDPKVLSDAISIDQSLLDIKQSESQVWPRFSVEAGVEIPLSNGSSGTEANFDGGLFLQYDIMKALFFKDAVFVADVRRKRLNSEKLVSMNRLYYRLVNLISDIRFRSRVLAILDKAVSTTGNAIDFIAGHDDHSDKQYDLLQLWRRKSQANRRQVTENRLQLEFLVDTLKQLTGLSNVRDIEITNFEEEVSAPSETDPAFYAESATWISDAWANRGEARIAEMDLYLAEMGIVEAKRKRLPRITASLGFGDIHLTTEDEDATIVPRFGLSIPFLDMGDIKRSIAKAEKQRDIATEGLAGTAKQIAHEVREAAMEAELSGYQCMDAKEKLAEADQALDATQDLFSLKRAEPMDLNAAKLAALDCALAYEQLLFKYRSSLYRLEAAKGVGVHAVESIIEEKSTAVAPETTRH